MTEVAPEDSRQPRLEPAERLMLIIEDDVDKRAAKLKELAACQRLSVLGVPNRDCVEVALAISPRALLIEATESGEISPLARQILVQDSRVLAIIFGHVHAERARLQYPAMAARLHGIGVPVRPEEIEALLLQHVLNVSGAGFFSPAECLQAAGIGRHSLNIECISARGVRLGSIVMEAGEIVAAQTPSRTGFEAFRELVTGSGVRAVLRPPVHAEAQADLAGAWQYLLLEAFRLHDQAQRGASDPADDSRPAFAAPAPASTAIRQPDRSHEKRVSPSPDTRDEVRRLMEEGIVAVIARDYETAIESLEKAARLEPNNPSIQHQLTRLHAVHPRRRG